MELLEEQELLFPVLSQTSLAKQQLRVRIMSYWLAPTDHHLHDSDVT